MSDMGHLMQCCPVELCLVSMLDLAPITLVMLGGGVASWEGQAVGEKRDYYRLPAATLWGWHVPVCRLQPQVSLWSAYIYLAKGWFHVKPLSYSGQAGHLGPFWSFWAISVIQLANGTRHRAFWAEGCIVHLRPLSKKTIWGWMWHRGAI